MQNIIIFEQPLNERMRTFMRLECLFRRLGTEMRGQSDWACRNALQTTLEIYSISDRGDLRTEVIKELDRHTNFLAALDKNPKVDRELLSRLLDEIEHLVDNIQALDGPVGSTLKSHDFLNSVMNRSGIPGGTCDFDLPALQFWLAKAVPDQIKDLSSWARTFEPIAKAIEVVLRTIRESAKPQKESAEGGTFQRQLDKELQVQIVRVGVPQETRVYPEISGGKYRVSVRFLEQNNLAVRAQQTSRNIAFELSCCGI